MASVTVKTERKLSATARNVWAKLCEFDLSWHPGIKRCALIRQSNGALLREFSDTNDQCYRELQTYISNTDKVLCYRLLSGVTGLLSYNARVEVLPAEEGGCVIRWRAQVSALPENLDVITRGTAAVFEAAFDALDNANAVNPAQINSTTPLKIHKRTVRGGPRLSYFAPEVVIENEQPVVVFLHGIGGNANNWLEQISVLGNNYCVAALNLRGYGDSALGSQATSIDDYCGDINRLVDAFGASRVVLVGLSYGSWIATSYAMRYPDKLCGLILAGGCTGMSEAGAEERSSFLKTREVPLSEGKTPADFAPAVVDVIAGPNATESQRSALFESMAAISNETYRDALHCFCNPIERFDFSKLRSPVMLITGEYDKLAPPAEIRRVSERIFEAQAMRSDSCDVRFEVLRNAGHVCNVEKPDEFTKAIEQFLKRLPGVALDYKSTVLEKQHIKRERILTAAHTEFCTNGFDGASMERVATLADVSKPTLYQYFGDKNGLFSEVLNVGRTHLITTLFTRDGSLVERLWKFSWTYADFVLRPDMLSLARLILGEAERRPQSAVAYHQSGPGKALDGIVSFVEACEQAGLLKVDDAQLAAQDLWSLILSGPRDYYLHHVNVRPEHSQVSKSIGHGLKIFIIAYSTNLKCDLAELQELVNAKSLAS